MSNEVPPHEALEKYAAGDIEVRHGKVDLWLILVYGALFAWAVFYGFSFWGGPGPGLDY